MKSHKIVTYIIVVLAMSSLAYGQSRFNYEAQKAFIHKDLGKIYLGMPLTELMKQIDISNADAGPRRYDHLELDIPYDKGNIEGLVISVHGIDAEMQQDIISTKKGMVKNFAGESFEIDIYTVDVKKNPTNAFVYAITIKFKSDFDAKEYVYKTFGEGGTEHDPSDDHKFYDTQWVKKTSDGLGWLIRSFHGDRKDQRLQLLGRIDGTPWGLDGIN